MSLRDEFLPQELLALGQLALLIVCDYDGTLAPIVARPQDAVPETGARAALGQLQVRPGREVAVLSGRRAEEVRTFLQLPDLRVVGLHGMQWPDEAESEPDRGVIADLLAQLPQADGLRLEDKGATLAVHYREVAEPKKAAVEARLADVQLPQGWEVMAGKMVREFRPAGFGKGRALRRLAAEHPGLLPVFLGDDVTDEEGFEVALDLGGAAVKVGAGETRAPHHLDGPAEVVALLEAWGRE